MAEHIPHGQSAARAAAEIVDNAYHAKGVTPDHVGLNMMVQNSRDNSDPKTGIGAFVSQLNEKRRAQAAEVGDPSCGSLTR